MFIIAAGIVGQLYIQDASSGVNPCFSIPDVSDGLRGYPILRSEQFAIADLLAE
jgi:hypothetical protein